MNWAMECVQALMFAATVMGVNLPAEIKGECPALEVIDQSSLVALYRASEVVDGGESPFKPERGDKINGVYLPDYGGSFGTILVDENFNLTSIYGQSFIRHEMTHFLQARLKMNEYRSEFTTGCFYHAKSEREAYDVQIAFLETQGASSELIDKMKWSRFIFGQCRDDNPHTG